MMGVSCHLLLVLCVAQRVLDLNHGAAHDGPARRVLVPRPHWVEPLQQLEEFARHVAVGDQVQKLPVEPIQDAELRTAQARCAVDDRVKDRLDVSLRARDHAQDLSSGALLLAGLAQVALQQEPRAAATLAALTGAADWRPTFAFRMGFPTRAAAPSPRRPLDAVVVP
jgi:hypothetical protein